MHGSAIRTWLVAAAVALAAPPMRAQVAYDSPRGRVEILGLQRWSLKMLRDSVRSRVPGMELHDAACMAVLRNSLGFADALVSHLSYSASPNAPAQEYLIIKLIEPHQRARVQWLKTERDTFTVLRPDYAPIVMAVTDTNGGLHVGRVLWPLQFYGRGPKARNEAVASAPASMRADAERLWIFLEGRRTEADWRRAIRTLRGDGQHANRLIAASVLANFPDRDSTWYALTEALRDPRADVRAAAASVLREFPARRIDWTPQVKTLRLLLGGTNVDATEQVVEMLARTQVSPSLARRLLRQNAYWVLTHLRAEYPGAATSARALLVQLHGGVDLGPGSAKWNEWIKTL